MDITILSGGPLGGQEVETWEVDSIKEFTSEAGAKAFYRSDVSGQAIYVGGSKPTDTNVVLGDTITIVT